MVEDELVSEKDVLLLQTGFLKWITNRIKFPLPVLVKSNKYLILYNFIQNQYLELREPDSEDVAVASKQLSAEA